jgi:RNA polymerase sigma factor (sigma-70 family)|tara:strand:+ start:264 stop:1028 length:765 start_codon:yes stop_codon:yes gene_type:complete
MKKYNIQNYVRFKEDVKRSMPGEDYTYDTYTRDELIVKFIPLVENLARKFSTSDQASGVLSINDLIQEGNAGLTIAVDKLDWVQLNDSDDIEKTLKSFLSKRIKGAIRRAIDINRGDIKIPENKLIQIRKNPNDDKLVALFFNSVFTSYDNVYEGDDDDNQSWASMIADDSKPYNVDLLNAYLLGIMKEHLNYKQYHVLRMSYGLDCDKASAKEIAAYVGITVSTAVVIVSQIKKEATDCLIANVDATQVIDYL